MKPYHLILILYLTFLTLIAASPCTTDCASVTFTLTSFIASLTGGKLEPSALSCQITCLFRSLSERIKWTKLPDIVTTTATISEPNPPPPPSLPSSISTIVIPTSPQLLHAQIHASLVLWQYQQAPTALAAELRGRMETDSRVVEYGWRGIPASEEGEGFGLIKTGARVLGAVTELVNTIKRIAVLEKTVVLQAGVQMKHIVSWNTVRLLRLLVRYSGWILVIGIITSITYTLASPATPQSHPLHHLSHQTTLLIRRLLFSTHASLTSPRTHLFLFLTLLAWLALLATSTLLSTAQPFTGRLMLVKWMGDEVCNRCFNAVLVLPEPQPEKEKPRVLERIRIVTLAKVKAREVKEAIKAAKDEQEIQRRVARRMEKMPAWDEGSVGRPEKPIFVPITVTAVIPIPTPFPTIHYRTPRPSASEFLAIKHERDALKFEQYRWTSRWESDTRPIGRSRLAPVPEAPRIKQKHWNPLPVARTSYERPVDWKSPWSLPPMRDVEEGEEAVGVEENQAVAVGGIEGSREEGEVEGSAAVEAGAREASTVEKEERDEGSISEAALGINISKSNSPSPEAVEGSGDEVSEEESAEIRNRAGEAVVAWAVEVTKSEPTEDTTVNPSTPHADEPKESPTTNHSDPAPKNASKLLTPPDYGTTLPVATWYNGPVAHQNDDQADGFPRFTTEAKGFWFPIDLSAPLDTHKVEHSHPHSDIENLASFLQHKGTECSFKTTTGADKLFCGDCFSSPPSTPFNETSDADNGSPPPPPAAPAQPDAPHPTEIQVQPAVVVQPVQAKPGTPPTAPAPPAVDATQPQATGIDVQEAPKSIPRPKVQPAEPTVPVIAPPAAAVPPPATKPPQPEAPRSINVQPAVKAAAPEVQPAQPEPAAPAREVQPEPMAVDVPPAPPVMEDQPEGMTIDVPPPPPAQPVQPQAPQPTYINQYHPQPPPPAEPSISQDFGMYAHREQARIAALRGFEDNPMNQAILAGMQQLPGPYQRWQPQQVAAQYHAVTEEQGTGEDQGGEMDEAKDLFEADGPHQQAPQQQRFVVDVGSDSEGEVDGMIGGGGDRDHRMDDQDADAEFSDDDMTGPPFFNKPDPAGPIAGPSEMVNAPPPVIQRDQNVPAPDDGWGQICQERRAKGIAFMAANTPSPVPQPALSTDNAPPPYAPGAEAGPSNPSNPTDKPPYILTIMEAYDLHLPSHAFRRPQHISNIAGSSAKLISRPRISFILSAWFTSHANTMSLLNLHEPLNPGLRAEYHPVQRALHRMNAALLAGEGGVIGEAYEGLYDLLRKWALENGWNVEGAGGINPTVAANRKRLESLKRLRR